MEHKVNLQVNRFIIFVSLLLLSSCAENHVIDVNMEVPDNNWTYAKNLKATVEIKDADLTYNVFFKLRNTSDYRYSNLYVLMHLRGDSLSKNARYQFQLAKPEGKWIGKGSGDLYSNTFPLLNKFRFPKAGKYQIEVEQNMRDNPLLGISDVGILIEKNTN